MWNYTQTLAAEELKDTEPIDFTSIDPEKVRDTIAQIDEAFAAKPVGKEVKQKINYAKRNWAKKLEEYKEKEKILGGRNSFSKTDTDAIFMRIKEDHM